MAAQYGYQEIRTPVFEDTDLFVRTSGDTSDVVTKEMYTFTDRGDRSITLKPEGTAPAIRAYLQHSLGQTGAVTRLWYNTPIFRYERPQKGRFRQSHQFGLELIGSPSASADAEVIEFTSRFYESIGVGQVEALVNSIGRQATRARFRTVLLEKVAAFLKDQPAEERARVEKNPLRLLDSKDPAVQAMLQDVPPITNFLEDDSKAHFDELCQLLSDAGVRYRIAPEVVRGLDYYTDSVFEVHSTLLGSQSALCGGGRYDNLIKEIGGPETPSVGVGMGIERALIALEGSGKLPAEPVCDVAVIAAGAEAWPHARKLARDLRAQSLRVLIDLDGKSLKSQLKMADKAQARFAAIIGEDELAAGKVMLRNLATSDQNLVDLSELIGHVK